MTCDLELFLDDLHKKSPEGEVEAVLNAVMERGLDGENGDGKHFISLYGIKGTGADIIEAADDWILVADLKSVFGIEATA